MGVQSSLIGSLKELEFTYHAQDEVDQGDPGTDLPGAQPGTPQISYTVAAGHIPATTLPIIDGKLIAMIVSGGQNKSGATRVVYYRMKKNGGNVATGNKSVSAGYFWTFSHFFYDVAVDDVLDIYLWDNGDLTYWRYKADEIIYISRFKLILGEEDFMYHFIFERVKYPVLLLGPDPYGAIGSNTPRLYVRNHNQYVAITTTLFDASPWAVNPTYGLFRAGYGDTSYANNTYEYAHATRMPYIGGYYKPDKLTIRSVRSMV